MKRLFILILFLHTLPCVCMHHKTSKDRLASIRFIVHNLPNYKLFTQNNTQISLNQINATTLDTYYKLLQSTVFSYLSEEEVAFFKNCIRKQYIFMVPTPVTESIAGYSSPILANHIRISGDKKRLYVTDNLNLTYAYDIQTHLFSSKLIKKKRKEKIPLQKNTPVTAFNGMQYGILNGTLVQWHVASFEYALCTYVLFSNKYNESELKKLKNTNVYKQLKQKEKNYLDTKITQIIMRLQSIESISNNIDLPNKKQ